MYVLAIICNAVGISHHLPAHKDTGQIRAPPHPSSADNDDKDNNDTDNNAADKDADKDAATQMADKDAYKTLRCRQHCNNADDDDAAADAHNEMASKAKLSTEGALEEQKIILGWYFDIQLLTIAIPENKLIAWTESINSMLLTGKTTPKDLEQLIGRLGHLGMVVPFVHHFLSRLGDLHHCSKKWRGVALPDKCKKDLELILYFLEIGGKGVNMNFIACLAPTHTYHSDLCPTGLGWYSNEGFSWCYSIPQSLQFQASNNLLKFLAAIITLSIDIHANCLQSEDCTLSMTDSSTAEGWMHKTIFRESNKYQIQTDVRIKAAQKFTIDFTKHGIKSYSQ
jgi:hypothetical protein